MITHGKLIPDSDRDVLIVASQNTLIAYGTLSFSITL